MKITRELMAEAIALGWATLPRFTVLELAQVLGVPPLIAMKAVQANSKHIRFDNDKNILGLEIGTGTKMVNTQEAYNWFIAERCGGKPDNCLHLQTKGLIASAVNTRIQWSSDFASAVSVFLCGDNTPQEAQSRVARQFGGRPPFDINRMVRLGVAMGHGQVPERYFYGIVLTQAEGEARVLGGIPIYSTEWATEAMLCAADWVDIPYLQPQPTSGWTKERIGPLIREGDPLHPLVVSDDKLAKQVAAEMAREMGIKADDVVAIGVHIGPGPKVTAPAEDYPEGGFKTKEEAEQWALKRQAETGQLQRVPDVTPPPPAPPTSVNNPETEDGGKRGRRTQAQLLVVRKEMYDKLRAAGIDSDNAAQVLNITKFTEAEKFFEATMPKPAAAPVPVAQAPAEDPNPTTPSAPPAPAVQQNEPEEITAAATTEVPRPASGPIPVGIGHRAMPTLATIEKASEPVNPIVAHAPPGDAVFGNKPASAPVPVAQAPTPAPQQFRNVAVPPRAPAPPPPATDVDGLKASIRTNAHAPDPSGGTKSPAPPMHHPMSLSSAPQPAPLSAPPPPPAAATSADGLLNDLLSMTGN